MTTSPRSSRPSWQKLGLVAISSFTVAQALGFECSNIVADSVHWDLKALDGVHIIHHSYLEEPSIANWTFAINLCGTLPYNKDVDKHSQCPQNSKVCGLKTIHNSDNSTSVFEKWVAIAGHYDMSSGNTLEVKPTRLKNTGSREGLVLEMTGGKDPFQKQKGIKQTKQKAIIEMICDREKTGWEPLEEPKLRRRDDDEDDDAPGSGENPGSSLIFHSYDEEVIREEIWQVLRVQWQTRYACEDYSSTAPSPRGNGWGFFTWMIIILFLGIAGYVIMGSWVNYNQHGARGFDLVPHADTIRDIPYIMKDMFRKVQTSGSRGGYSAV